MTPLQAHLLHTYVNISVKLDCAEAVLPYVLRTGDFYALRAEGQALVNALSSAAHASREPGNAEELVYQGYEYHDRLAVFLSATEDASGCGQIPWTHERIEPGEDLNQPPPAPPKDELARGLLWGVALTAVIGGAAWALAR